MSVNDFLNAICEVLEKAPGTLSLDDTPETVKEWDSLGHLGIISIIDENLNVSINDEELRDFASIRELVDRLKARSALED